MIIAASGPLIINTIALALSGENQFSFRTVNGTSEKYFILQCRTGIKLAGVIYRVRPVTRCGMENGAPGESDNSS